MYARPYRDPHDEQECIRCGLLRSDCVCCPRDPSTEEIERSRAQRLTRREQELTR